MRSGATILAFLAALSGCDGDIGGGDDDPHDAAAPGEDAATVDGGGGGDDAGQTADAGEGEDAGPDVDPLSTDPAFFYGDSRCADADLVLCDGFEDVAAGGTADPAIWTTSDDRLLVEEGQHARGQRALHVVTHSTEALHFIRTTTVAPALSHRMWGRLFFRKDGTRPGAFNHWTVAEATGIVPEGGTGRIRYGGIMVPDVVDHYIFNYDIWGDRPEGFHEVGAEDQVDIPDHAWHCIEWMFDVDTREARFYRDAVEDPGLEAAGRIDDIDLAFPPMDGLNIGWAIYQDIGADEWDVWIDEVAADDERIGCVR